jgi:hypothetical protein
LKYYFKGKTKWAKVYDTPKDDTFKDKKGRSITKPAAWSLDLYMDDASIAAYKKSGIQRKIREDADGHEYVSFERPLKRMIKDEEITLDPPTILDSENNPYEGSARIGNDSVITISVDVYDSKMGKGCRLEAIRIEELVEYTKDAVSEDTPVDMPF